MNTFRCLVSFMCCFCFSLLGQQLICPGDCPDGSATVKITPIGFHGELTPTVQTHHVTGKAQVEDRQFDGSEDVDAWNSVFGFGTDPHDHTICVGVDKVFTISATVTGDGIEGWLFDGNIEVCPCYAILPLFNGRPDGIASSFVPYSILDDDPYRSYRVIKAGGGTILFEEHADPGVSPGPQLLKPEECQEEKEPGYIRAYIPIGPGSQWKFVGDNLGCSLSQVGGEAIITPGDQSGVIKLQCKDSVDCLWTGSWKITAESECQDCQEFSAMQTELASVLVKVHLGKDRYHRDAGYLYLHESKNPVELVAGDEPSDPAVATEGPFKHRFTQRRAFRSLVEEIPNGISLLPSMEMAYTLVGGAIRQIRVASGLVDILEPAADRVEINCYANDQFTTLAATALDGARWAVNPNAVPVNRVVVYNPDQFAVPVAYNRLWVSETRMGGAQKTYQYQYAGGTWSLSNDDGTEWREAGPLPAGLNTIGFFKRSWKLQNGQAVTTHYESKTLEPGLFGWRRVQKQVGIFPDTPRITQYSYHSDTDSDPNLRGRLKSVLYPDGNWEYYKSYDAQGRLTKKLLPFNDSPLSSSPAEASCRSEEYDYGSQDPDDPVLLEKFAPRKIIRKVLGQVVSIEYWVVTVAPGPLGGDNLIILDQRRSAKPAPTLAECELVTQWYFRKPNVIEGEGAASLVKPVLGGIAYPDGTTRTYTYSHFIRTAGGSYVEFPGYNYEANPSGQAGGVTWDWAGAVLKTVVTEGHRTGTGLWLAGGHRETVTYTDVMGNPLSETVMEPAGPSGTVVASATYDYGNDALRHSYTLITLDQKTETVTRDDCCGARTVRDKEGVATKYTQDFWKRQANVVRYFTPGSATGPAVTESSIMDINGRVLVERRTGTSGVKVDINQYLYNTAGEVTRHTNALQGITTYSESAASGYRVRTTTYPDQGTVTESYFMDGRLQSVTGSAAAGVAYERGVEFVTDFAGMGYREHVTRTRLNASGLPTLEWTKTYFDAAGRAYRTVYPARPGIDTAGNPERQRHFNSRGQLWKEIDPDGVTTLYGYNVKGELECVALARTIGAPTPAMRSRWTRCLAITPTSCRPRIGSPEPCGKWAPSPKTP